MTDEKRLEEIRERAASSLNWRGHAAEAVWMAIVRDDVPWLLEQLEQAHQERRGAREELERTQKKKHFADTQCASVIRALKEEHAKEMDATQAKYAEWLGHWESYWKAARDAMGDRMLPGEPVPDAIRRLLGK